jgi:hypothetical protein
MFKEIMEQPGSIIEGSSEANLGSVVRPYFKREVSESSPQACPRKTKLTVLTAILLISFQ